MAMQTPTTNAVMIPEVWAREIEKNRENNLVMTKLVDHKFEKDVMNFGDTIHVPFIKSLTAQNVTPGTALNFAANTETEVLITIDKYVATPIQIQDMLKVQSKYDLRKPYTAEISRSLAVALDTSLLEEYTNAGKTRTAVPALTFEEIVDANTDLDAANVPQDDRALVVDAVGLGDLRKIKEFTAFKETGEKSLVKGNKGIVGEIYGVPVYITNAIIEDGTNRNYLLFHKSAIAAVVQMKPKLESDRDLTTLSDRIVGSQIWGVKTLRPDHMVVIPRTK